jgi:hypothetical protein
MATVFRNGRPYLYRSVRRNGRVTSEYRGSGEDARLIAALESIERDEKDAKRREERSERKQLDDLDRALEELAQRAQALARDALTAAGYHQHDRGEWRRRRVRYRCECESR